MMFSNDWASLRVEVIGLIDFLASYFAKQSLTPFDAYLLMKYMLERFVVTHFYCKIKLSTAHFMFSLQDQQIMSCREGFFFSNIFIVLPSQAVWFAAM